MNHSEMHDLMEDVFDQLEDLREAGQAEYAHDEDNCFANFDRTAERLKISREKALAVHWMKHVDGITAYLNGHTSQREAVYGRLLDAMMYLLLLYGMVEEAEFDANYRGEGENPFRITTNWTCEECGKVRNSRGCYECQPKPSPTYSDPPQWWRPETRTEVPHYLDCPCHHRRAS